MWGREGWRRIVTGRTPDVEPAAAQRADVIRERLAALEIQHLDLLADESVPGRKHRLDAVRAARRDLEEELDELDDGAVCVPAVLRAGG